MKGFKEGFIAGARINKYKKITLLVLLLIVITAGFSFFDGWLSKSVNPFMPARYEGALLTASAKALGRYFEVKNVSDPKSYRDQYEYSIFTRGHDLLDRDIADKYPEISYPDISKWNGFIKLSIYYFGMGGDTCRYYDIDRGLVSDWFWYPVGECDKYVVCVDMPASAEKLIVRSIFDDSYYREFPMKLLQGWGEVLKRKQQAPVISAEFIDDAKRLRVTYQDEEGYEKTETLDLY